MLGSPNVSLEINLGRIDILTYWIFQSMNMVYLHVFNLLKIISSVFYSL